MRPMDAPRQTVAAEFTFTGAKPGFGDLFRIFGEDHPNFPPEGQVDFAPLAHLQVTQVDDYFGVPTTSGDGAEVAVWLYPLIDGQQVDHDPGPFDGLRLEYDALRNPDHRAAHFQAMVEAFAKHLPATLTLDGQPATPADVHAATQTAIRDWRAHGIEPGSPGAMSFDT